MIHNETRELIRAYQRRLGKLEIQRAQIGIHVDPAVMNEIEDIYKELTRLMVRTLSLNEARPPRFLGLMVLVGPGRKGEAPLDQSAIDAIHYHLRTLRWCWLIGSSGPNGSQQVVEELQKHCQFHDITAFPHYVNDPFSVQESFELIDRLYCEDIPVVGLNEEQVIADITGATKPMSFGMLRACGTRRPMQYMVRQPDGPSLPMMLRYILSTDNGENPIPPL